MLIGFAQFVDEHYDAAAEALQAAFVQEPTSAPTAFLLGWVHSNAGRSSDAITAWRNAVRLDPTMTAGYLALADAYVRLSHPELAAQALKDGLRALPKSTELQVKLAEVERRTGR